MSELQIVNVVSLSANHEIGNNNQMSLDQEEEIDKPLLQVLKSWIYDEEHTNKKLLLTNLALKQIMQKEFNINVDYTTKVESEIYLKAFKSLLKMWPQQEEFDQLVDRARKNKNFNVKVMLNRLYILLKDYLSVNLDITKERMKPYMESLEKQSSEEQKKNKSNAEDSSEVVMEITSTRLQLNHLIFSKPNPKLDNTIFNIVEGSYSSKIGLQTFTLKQILNWPFVQVSVKVPGFKCYRRNNSLIERSIVNLKNPQNAHRDSLDMEEIFYRKPNTKFESAPRQIVLSFLHQLTEKMKLCDIGDQDLFRFVLSEFQVDFSRGPPIIQAGEYQFYLNAHRYVRHLVTEMTELQPKEQPSEEDGINPNNFVLRLEEVLTPMQILYIPKLTACTKYKESENSQHVDFVSLDKAFDENVCGLGVHCLLCEIKFDLRYSAGALLQHFVDHHQYEHDWGCTSCHRSFNMTYLAGKRWVHPCNGKK